MQKSKIHFLAQAAVIAGLYAILTLISSALNLAYGPVQFRFSEALTILPVFTPAAIPGLTLGCFISNLASPLGPVDWIFGTAATLIAAVFSHMLRNIRLKDIPILAPLSPVIFNALIIGFEIAALSEQNLFALSNLSLAAFIPNALSVGAGELVVCYVLGIPLYLAIVRSKLYKSKLPNYGD